MIHRIKKQTDRLHQYCCVKYPSYGAWHEHPYYSHTHWFLFFVFFVGWVMGLFFQLRAFPVRFAGAAAYTWSQSSWAGGATANNPNHTSNRTNWTEYNTKDATTISAGATITQQSGGLIEDFTGLGYKDAANTGVNWDNYIEFIRLRETDKWALRSVFPSSFSGGVLIPSGGSTYLYALKGSTFWRYNIGGDWWEDDPVADVTAPASVSSGIGSSSAILVGADTIYALGGSTRFYKYTISTNTWSTLAVHPAGLSVGALGYAGAGDCIYTLSASRFDAYSISGDNWNSTCGNPTDPPAATGAGVSMTWANTNYLFAFRGGYNSDDFWAYSMSSNNWTMLDPTDPPKNVASGGSLTWVNASGVSDYIFAIPGDLDRDVWAYSLSGNTWTMLYPQWTHESSATQSVMTNNGWTSGAGLTYPGAGNYLYTAHGGNSTTFLRFEFLPNYQTPGAVQSTAIDTTSQAIAWATLTATQVLNGQTVAYQMSRDGGQIWEDVTSGTVRVFTSGNSEKSDLRWRATLSGIPMTSPNILSVTIFYTYYPASASLTSSTFNSEAVTTQVTQMAWSETVPSGTNVRFQVRTAPDSSGSPGTWSDWLGPTSTTDYYETTSAGETVNSTNSSGANDQWMQYKAYLTSSGVDTPTLSNATLSYNILPATPSLSSDSHPSQTTFYSVATPSITITAGLPTPAHYHYLVNQTASLTIVQVAAGTQAAGSFTVPGGAITAEGTWYVHVVSHDSGEANSANFASYTIKYDPNAPTVPTLSFGSIASTSITVSGSTSDTGAGLHATPLYFERDSGAANSGWISGNWTDSGLSPNTQYSYRVKARDATTTANESAFSGVTQKYTAANTPGTPTIASATSTTITLTLNTNSNPAATQFSIQESSSGQYVQQTGATETLGVSETWLTAAQWGTITVTGLSEDTQYSFRVRARNGDNTVTSFSSSASGSTGAGSPQNFRATSTGASSVTLTADDPSYTATAWYFSRSGANSGWTGTNSWTDSGLSPNTAYTYSVKTRNMSLTESASASLSTTTAALAPDTPSVDTTMASDVTVALTLASSSNPASTQYAIREVGVNANTNAYLQAGGALDGAEAWQTLAQWGTVTVSSLSPATTYAFTVKAKNSDGVETQESSSRYAITLTRPGTPSVTTVATTRNAITLSLPSSVNASTVQYAIRAVTGQTTSYVQTDGTLNTSEAWQTIAQWGTVTVTGLTADTEYTFSAKARASQTATATSFGSGTTERTLAQGTPRTPTVTAQSASSVLVTIDNTDIDPSFTYAIHETTTTNRYVGTNARLGNDPAWQLYAGWGGASGVLVIDLLPQTPYTFRVGALNPATGLTKFGPVASVTTPGGGAADYTPPIVPSDIAVVPVASGGIRLTWSDPSDADFAAVYIYRALAGNIISTGSVMRIPKGQGQFHDLGVLPGRTYDYLFRFEDARGNPSFSRLFAVQSPFVTEVVQPQVPVPEKQITPTPTRETVVAPPPPPPVEAEIPIPVGPRALPSVNIRELIRVQHPVTTQSVVEQDGCVSGIFLCTLNRLFRVERKQELTFLVDSFVPSRRKQESLRTRLETTDTFLRVVGVFGGLYDVIPQGRRTGDAFLPAVKISIRYNPRDAALLLRGGQSLELAYFNTALQKWEIIAGAEQNIPEGSWTATVGKAGTYGIVIVEKSDDATK